MPNLEIFLIGAPRCGKSAVFDALTMTPEGPHFTTRSGHRYGVVKVPDARLDALATMFRPKRVVPAEVTWTDPGFAGSGTASADRTATWAEADAFALVVQAFGEVDAEGRPLDPVAQAEEQLLHLVMSDLEKIGKRLERMAQERQRGQKINESERDLLERLRAELDRDRALREVPLRPDEEKMLRTYRFLSQKAVFLVANIAETALGEGVPKPLHELAARRGLEILPFCAPLETELARLDPESQRTFLADYGLREPGRVRLLQTAFRSLRLISFFTVGEDEVRAWPIPEGTTAVAAAGKIHSDLERGFIRAEVVACDELLRAGSLARCRESGTLRIEGRDYVVKDGDVMHIRFSV